MSIIAGRHCFSDPRIYLLVAVASSLFRGEAPPFNGAWGTMHVFRALYQQLSSEVEAQLKTARRDAAVAVDGGGVVARNNKPPSVAEKRVAWNDRATVQWQVALRRNEQRCAPISCCLLCCYRVV
jgi:hypothetical protein